jgi:hypothetical protein
MNTLRTVAFGLIASSCLAVSGCDYFGTHEGYEEGEGGPAWEVQGSSTYEVIGVSPSVASVGDSVDVYMASETESQVDRFTIDDFWFCTFDGESAMIETGGEDYTAEVDRDAVLENDDIDITEAELGDRVVSTASFTVPSGSVTGESLVITPSETQYFYLTIQ